MTQQPWRPERLQCTAAGQACMVFSSMKIPLPVLHLKCFNFSLFACHTLDGMGPGRIWWVEDGYGEIVTVATCIPTTCRRWWAVFIGTQLCWQNQLFGTECTNCHVILSKGSPQCPGYNHYIHCICHLTIGRRPCSGAQMLLTPWLPAVEQQSSRLSCFTRQQDVSQHDFLTSRFNLAFWFLLVSHVPLQFPFNTSILLESVGC